jgi:flagella basal body P-ring formation protein FlgA
LRKNHGTFVVKCGKRSHFLRYTLTGHISLYKAAHQIKKDRIITEKDLQRVTVPFLSLRGEPLGRTEVDRSIARRNIAKGKTVTRDMVAPIPDVRKGERVHCLYREGPVEVEFDAIALKNGYVGDTVTLKKESGKTLRGVVTGKRSVEIR